MWFCCCMCACVCACVVAFVCACVVEFVCVLVLVCAGNHENTLCPQYLQVVVIFMFLIVAIAVSFPSHAE